MTAAEAMEYGLIDRVLESAKDLPSLVNTPVAV
jgi:ATP-dependent protease ClpP protease subunit